ncbi:hypothetical protein [Winogradskyella sp. UBA3174]|uniref:hypothetical protein n=1 Tax=Winogradskyella sp. UBA3174 TaxID=1947785 RepID=UPI0025F9699F|nr:hypothetical protein [Winogradskyella sp. UBA3174]|tara:strand:- start:717 stop:1130 length:414 start_codon:yes stop_codon:yes gene_type:complete
MKLEIPTCRILDDILFLLLSYENPSFNKIFDEINPRIIDMDFVSKALPNHNWNVGQKELIKEKLLQDLNKNLKINQKGQEFIQNGGYYFARIKESQKIELQTQSDLLNKKYNKKLTIFGLVIFVIQITSIYCLKYIL